MLYTEWDRKRELCGGCPDLLALTRRTEYALIALTHLARCGGHLASAREIADNYNVPLPLLMNILKRLTQRGLVRSVRGARGGYVLALSSQEITVEKLIHAVEGPVCLTQCIAERDGVPRGICEVQSGCPVKFSVRSINQKLRELLGQVTIAQLAEKPEACPASAAAVAEA